MYNYIINPFKNCFYLSSFKVLRIQAYAAAESLPLGWRHLPTPAKQTREDDPLQRCLGWLLGFFVSWYQWYLFWGEKVVNFTPSTRIFS